MSAQPFPGVPVASLRHRLVLEAPVEADDGAGGRTRHYAAVASLWGRVAPLKGGEDDVADATGQVLTHRVWLRWRAGVDASMRLRFGERILSVRSVTDPGERRRSLVLLCQEVRP